MKTAKSILLIEDDKLTRMSLRHKLESFGEFCIEEAESKDQAFSKIKAQEFDLIFIDLDLDERLAGLEIIKKLSDHNSYKVVMSSHTEEDIITMAYKNGCHDYFNKTQKQSSLEKILKRFEIKTKNIKKQLGDYYYCNEEELNVLSLVIEKTLASDLPIMILGETGSGKTKLVDFIHKQINHKMPLVHINCSELSENLIESELFGHEKGSFTGAIKNKKGVLELAHNGLLFLDEIGTLPLSVQKKLLKAIEEKTFYPVGSEKMIYSNFRLITATCEDLKKKVLDKELREDFYFRIEGQLIKLKSLKERNQDILPLINQQIEQSDRKIVLSPEAQEALVNYSWPGNLRELKKVMDSVLHLEKGYIEIVDLHFLNHSKKECRMLNDEIFNAVKLYGLGNVLEQLENEILEISLLENNSKVRKTLLDLKISNSTFYKIKNRNEL